MLISDLTKEDLHKCIKDFTENGFDDFECLCCYCSRCDNNDCKPEDCFPDADKEECFGAYKEMVSDALSEMRQSYIL